MDESLFWILVLGIAAFVITSCTWIVQHYKYKMWRRENPEPPSFIGD